MAILTDPPRLTPGGRVESVPAAETSPVVMWFRRDLRLDDNPALLAALAAGPTVPLFVVDPVLWGRSGPARRGYLAASLRALEASLDCDLVIRSGDPVDIVPAVVEEAGATAVHIAADFGPYGRQRDEAVERELAARGVPLERLGSPYAVAPGRVLKGDGTPYKVYTAFQKAWVDHGWRAPAGPPAAPRWHSLDGEDLPEVELPDGLRLPPAGEKAAKEGWAAFLADRVDDYDVDRDRPDLDGSSGMSTFLRWGEIHPRTMLTDLAGRRSRGAATYRKELAWREFYADVLHHRPDSARQDLRPEWRTMRYEDPGPLFDAWVEGRTGFPIVDAGMRELRATGRMHNRVRMIVASFLVKDLHVWWRHGAGHFMEWLADGDLASNQHNWQWVAGSGTDAAPYFRVFNPTGQGRRFDPDGSYVRRWVPELADLPGPEVHEPGQVDGYPTPVVDHADERREALARYEEVRARPDAG
jgi:deoxyribodipyrimidine photo-lyase